MYAPPGALDAVLALDRPGLLDDAYALRDVVPGDEFDAGPFRVRTRLLPHWLPNAGLRLSAGGRVLVYTGDSGPGPEVVDLAVDADLLLAEASYVDEVPDDARRYLGSAVAAGRQAREAGVRRLLLTHLLPGTDPGAAAAAARDSYGAEASVASSGLTVDLGPLRSG